MICERTIGIRRPVYKKSQNQTGPVMKVLTIRSGFGMWRSPNNPDPMKAAAHFFFDITKQSGNKTSCNPTCCAITVITFPNTHDGSLDGGLPNEAQVRSASRTPAMYAQIRIRATCIIVVIATTIEPRGNVGRGNCERYGNVLIRRKVLAIRTINAKYKSALANLNPNGFSNQKSTKTKLTISRISMQALFLCPMRLTPRRPIRSRVFNR